MTISNGKPAMLGRRSFLAHGAGLGVLAGLGMLPRGVLAASGVENGVLTARIYADISNIDPAFWTSAVDALVIRAIFATALEFETGTDTFATRPKTFKSYEVLDDTRVGFEIRPGLMYTNGYGEMTAEDAKFSFERIANPETKSPYVDDWSALDHVEVTGKYTGIIHLKQAFAPLFTTTLPGVSGVILPRAAIEAAGGGFSTQPPCFSGPYRIREWTPKTRLVLERNPEWTLDAPEFDEIHLIPIEDPKTAEMGFEAGDLDFTEVGVSSIRRYAAQAPADSTFEQFDGLNYYWMGINQDNWQLEDQRLRRAIQLAVDQTAIVEAAFLGGASPSAGIVAPGLIGSRKANIYSRDVEKARALLEEAGYGGGFPLTISIQQTAENLAAAQVIQANLAEVGIQVQINQYESGTFWSLGIRSEGEQWKDVQLFLMRFSMQPDPSWATMWFTPAQVGIWNWQGFDNAEFGELHDAAQRELDDAKRNEMYIRMQDLMEESGDFVFLNFVPIGALYRNTIVPALRADGEPAFSGFVPAKS